MKLHVYTEFAYNIKEFSTDPKTIYSMPHFSVPDWLIKGFKIPRWFLDLNRTTAVRAARTCHLM